VALLGAADIAELMATDPGLMAASTTRALGSWLGLALFLALAGLGARSLSRPGGRVLRRGLAAVLAASSMVLVAVHLAAHVGGLRPASVALLALLSLVLA
jgi:hypothetical protein